MAFRATLSRHSANAAEARRSLLKKVYRPFRGLEKDSPEYMKLALSGRVWEDYFEPGNSDKLGYTRVQEECRSTLAEIDQVKQSMRRPPALLGKRLVAEYAHQSVKIENNRLDGDVSHAMHNELCKTFFPSVELSSLSLRELASLPFPTSPLHVQSEEPEQAIELRNHIIASQWIAESAPRHPGETGLSEAHVRALSIIAMKDLGNRPGFFPWAFGPRIPLGEYRQTPIGVKSNPLAIFPYHLEVPACLRRYFLWRDKAHREKRLHPLILACHATVYFLQIHPFVDGNGRVSRMMMHDYMARQGYLPVVMLRLDRKEYLDMIRKAADGDPADFIEMVVATQLDWIHSYGMEDAVLEF